MKIGFYSEKAASRYGTVIYTTPTGGTTEVTAVQEANSLADYDDSSYKWDDKVMIGEVVSYVRSGKTGAYEVPLVPETEMRHPCNSLRSVGQRLIKQRL